VNQKTALKQEKQRLNKTGSSFWNKPANEVINIMKLAETLLTDKSPQETALAAHKDGTNRLLSRKIVTFSFSKILRFHSVSIGVIHCRLGQHITVAVR
jgi:hypothetical protein